MIPGERDRFWGHSGIGGHDTGIAGHDAGTVSYRSATVLRISITETGRLPDFCLEQHARTEDRDRLRAAARTIIMASPEFQRPLQDVGGKIVSDPTRAGAAATVPAAK
jgi:hypothetical protein